MNKYMKFCPDGRILITIDDYCTQIPKHMVLDKVDMTFIEWLQYFTQLK